MRTGLVFLLLLLSGCSGSGGGSGAEDDDTGFLRPDDDTGHGASNGTDNGLIEVVAPPVNESFDLQFTIIGAAEAHVDGENCVQVFSSDVFSIADVRIDAVWNSTSDADRELSLIIFFGEADGGQSGSSYATMDSPLSASHAGYQNVETDDVVMYGLNTGSLGVIQDLPVAFRLSFEYEGVEPVEFETAACSLVGPR